ncbi:MAG: putative toxin-antitoxin system toxin component, PIN family [Deltaproteobacteria bacterium]|nr:putative toxin-antitoxin system toxin component, PIN family [Deltaproteobacteria bacterium]
MLKVCLDTNILISGVLFAGKPAEIVSLAFNKKFELILSQIILNELEKNLLHKFDYSYRNTKKLVNRLLQISDLYEPTGQVNVIVGNRGDNLVLETAVIGGAKYLVTGDHKDLLPLKFYRNVRIIEAWYFLEVIK